MSTRPTVIGALLFTAWFCLGGAVLSAIGRGPSYVVKMPGETGPPSLGEAARRACSWLAWCCIWPRALYRWARGYGEVHGHFAADCPHRIEMGGADDATPPWDRYRHGKACRRQK